MSDTTPPLHCTCPHCGQQLTIPAQYAGQQGNCRFCKGTFVAALPEKARNKPKGRRTAVIVGAALFLLCLMGGWMVLQQGDNASTSPQPMDTLIEESRAPLPVNRNTPIHTAARKPGNSTELITLSDFGTTKFVSTSPVEQAYKYRSMPAEALHDQLEVGMTFAETLRILGNPHEFIWCFYSHASINRDFEWVIPPRHRLLVSFENDKISTVEINEMTEQEYRIQQFIEEYHRVNPTAPVHEGALEAMKSGLYQGMLQAEFADIQPISNFTIICPEESGITDLSRHIHLQEVSEDFPFEVHAKAYPHTVFSHWNVTPGGKQTGNPLRLASLPRDITIEAVFKQPDLNAIETRIKALADTTQRVRQLRKDMNLEELKQVMGRIDRYEDGFTRLHDKFEDAGQESVFKEYGYNITDNIRLKFKFIRGELSRIENQHYLEHPGGDFIIFDTQHIDLPMGFH